MHGFTIRILSRRDTSRAVVAAAGGGNRGNKPRSVRVTGGRGGNGRGDDGGDDEQVGTLAGHHLARLCRPALSIYLPGIRFKWRKLHNSSF